MSFWNLSRHRNSSLPDITKHDFQRFVSLDRDDFRFDLNYRRLRSRGPFCQLPDFGGCDHDVDDIVIDRAG